MNNTNRLFHILVHINILANPPHKTTNGYSRHMRISYEKFNLFCEKLYF